MTIGKFFRIRRENCDRDQIVKRQEIFIEENVGGKLVYTPITTAETYNDDDTFVIFHNKKPVYIQILSNDDLAAKLKIDESTESKRVIKTKKFSITPDAKSSRKRKADQRTIEMTETGKANKRLSDARKKVVSASDGLYCSKEKDSEVLQETNTNNSTKNTITKPHARGKKVSKNIEAIDFDEIRNYDSDDEIPKKIGRKSNSSSSFHYGSDDSDLDDNGSNITIVTIETEEQNAHKSDNTPEKSEKLSKEKPHPEVLQKTNTVNNLLRDPIVISPLTTKSTNDNMKSKPQVQENKAVSKTEMIDLRKMKDTGSEGGSDDLDLQIAGNTTISVDVETAEENAHSSHDVQQISTKSPKTSQSSGKVSEKRPVEVLSGVYIGEEWYDKAKDAIDVKSRVGNIINGYWSDEEAVKFCLKVRSDRRHLQQVSPKDITNIKDILEKINQERPVKPGKKKMASYTNFIRFCCSNNFKLRRQKLKGEGTSSYSCDKFKTENVTTDDELQLIDLEINNLIDKKNKIVESKKPKGEQDMENELDNKKEELRNILREIKQREVRLKKEKDEFYKELESYNTEINENAAPYA